MKVLFIVFIFIFILLFIQLRFVISFSQEKGLKVLLNIVFFRILIFPFKKGGKVGEKTKKFKKKEKLLDEKRKERKEKNKKKRKKDIFQILEFIKILIRPIPKFLRFLNRGFKISELNFQANVANEDARETVTLYYNFCRVFYYMLGLISSYCCIVKKDVNIVLDFINEKTEFCFKICFRIRIGRIIFGIFVYLFYITIDLISYFIFKSKRSV